MMITLENLIKFIYDYNIILLMFNTYSIIIVIFGILMFFKQYFQLPKLLMDIYLYGKLSEISKMSKYMQFLQLPKRWFLHFYILSFFLSVVSFYLLQLANSASVPSYAEIVLDILTIKRRIQAVSLEVSWLVLIVYSLHVWKRLYETIFISVFSDSKISVVHYVIALTHYLGAFIGLLSLFPGIAMEEGDVDASSGEVSLLFKFIQITGVISSLAASIIQFAVFRNLASMRPRDKDTSRNKYMMPDGYLFKHVSCPHMLLEIIVYVGLAATMAFRHYIWNSVTLFVCCNQVQIALMNHQWYKDHFKDYPINRKAIIPFLL